MIFHDFAKTLYFHVPFFVVFGQFRCFLVKARYIHVLFSLDYATVNLAVWKREKKRGLGTAPMQNHVFLRLLWSACFQNPVFVRSDFMNMVSPRSSRLPPRQQIFLEKHVKIGVLETCARKSTWKQRVPHQGIVETSFFAALSCRVSKTPMEFSRFICFLGAVLGPPLSRPQNRRFHTKTLIARSHFQRPDQIEIPGMCEGFRCG